jgi:CBS domain-containing protein
MTIRAIIQSKGDEVFSIEASMSVREAVHLLAERRIGALPVLEDGKVAGVFSERDVIYCLDKEGPGILDDRVGKVMTAPAITVTTDVSALAALSQMTKRRIRHLPVVEDDKLIAIVSIGDLVKYRIDRIEHEAEAMRTYIQSA